MLSKLASNEAAAPAPQLVSFFVHFHAKTLVLKSISTREAALDEEHRVVEIDADVAKKIMGGEESIFNYGILALNDGKFEFRKKTDEVMQMANRVDVAVVIQEILPSVVKSDINFYINKQSNIVEISYNGERLKQLSKPMKFYFTRKNDPSFLKCSLQLDVNILDEILVKNNLDTWPNPIRLKIDNVKDLSIYGIRGQLSASIKNGKVRNI